MDTAGNHKHEMDDSKAGTHDPFSPSSLHVKLDCAGRTDKGLQRRNNQDQFLIADLHKTLHIQQASQPFQYDNLYGSAMGKLLVVADGMGGANAGEVASELAIESLAQHLLNSMHWLFNPTAREIEQFMDDLRCAAKRSHRTIRETANTDPHFAGMGTTLTVAYLLWPMLYVLHVGDSRCYVMRQGRLQQLTKDQTLAQHLLDTGYIDGPAFESSPYHNVLLSVVGGNVDCPTVVALKTELIPDDRLLLCSDGVNAHLNDAEIEKHLGASRTAEEICQNIIDSTNARGGRDNITTIVALSRNAVPQNERE